MKNNRVEQCFWKDVADRQDAKKYRKCHKCSGYNIKCKEYITQSFIDETRMECSLENGTINDYDMHGGQRR